jgi:hypothetical protein
MSLDESRSLEAKRDSMHGKRRCNVLNANAMPYKSNVINPALGILYAKENWPQVGTNWSSLLCSICMR